MNEDNFGDGVDYEPLDDSVPENSIPTLEMYSSDDEMLGRLIVDLDNKMLNVEAQRFIRPSDRKSFTFNQFCELISDKMPSIETVDMMRSVILSLDDRFNIPRKEINSIFSRWVLSLESRTNYLLELESYAKIMQKRNQELNAKLESLNSDDSSLDVDLSDVYEKLDTFSKSIDNLREEHNILKGDISKFKDLKNKVDTLEVKDDPFTS